MKKYEILSGVPGESVCLLRTVTERGVVLLYRARYSYTRHMWVLRAANARGFAHEFRVPESSVGYAPEWRAAAPAADADDGGELRRAQLKLM